MHIKPARFVLWGLLVGIVLAGLIYLFRPQPVLVNLETVSVGEFTVSIGEEGKARVREIYSLAAPIRGRLMRIEAARLYNRKWPG